MKLILLCAAIAAIAGCDFEPEGKWRLVCMIDGKTTFVSQLVDHRIWRDRGVYTLGNAWATYTPRGGEMCVPILVPDASK